MKPSVVALLCFVVDSLFEIKSLVVTRETLPFSGQTRQQPECRVCQRSAWLNEVFLNFCHSEFLSHGNHEVSQNMSAVTNLLTGS